MRPTLMTYQLPEAPPPPKLPPPPLKLPLSLDDEPLLQPPDEEPLDHEPPDRPVDAGNRSAMKARRKPMAPASKAIPADPISSNARTAIRPPVAAEPSNRP